MRCSVVIPIYQEVQSVPTLHEALATVAGDLPDEVLRKVYHDNAAKILGLPPLREAERR